MIVYKPIDADRCELCHPVNWQDFETIKVQVNGQPRQATWKPIAMRLIQTSEGQKLLPSDSPWLGGSHALIFRTSAIVALGPLLREYGELLPLQCSEAKLSMFNPTRVLDALDAGASTLTRFDDGRIMWIQRYVFRPEVIRGVEIFKLANLRVSSTFVGQRFVEMWQAAGLKGLDFEQVWAGD